MTFVEKVTRRLRGTRLARLLGQRGLINTTDLLVATSATVILAAGVGGAAIATLSEQKYGKAQPDAQALAGAISQFYKDTGKWPGQAEHANLIATTGSGAGSVNPLYLVTSTVSTALPLDVATATAVKSTLCAKGSLEGFSEKTINAGNLTSVSATTNILNINNFLVTNPGPNYQNWRGPYLTGGAMSTDPWDRTWVFNLQALYCAEDVTSAASKAETSGTTLGNAWVLSAGNNRTLTTRLIDGGLDDDGDDTGTNMGKFVAKLVVPAS